MEYVTDRGQFADLPYVEWLAGMKKYYPNMMHTAGAPMPGGDFAAEAEAAQRG